MPEERVEKTFPVDGPAFLEVSNVCGAVDVQPGEDGVIRVEAVKRLDSGDPEHTGIEMTQDEDGCVRVKTRFRKGLGWFAIRRGPCRVEYSLRVPHSCSVKVRCVSSKATVGGLEGKFDLETVSGAMRVQDLEGKIRLHSVSGKITGERLSGPVELDTVSGKVRLSASDMPSVEASSVSGALVLETALGEGPYRFRTVSGSVRLAVPAGSGCSVEVHSVSGRLRTTLPITRDWEGDRRRRRAEIQGGGTKVRFGSVSGDLRLFEQKAEPD